MATTVTELRNPRSSSIDNKNVTKYTRTFQVITDNHTVGAEAVRIASGVPSIGDYYQTSTESDTSSICISKNANCTSEDGKSWEVTVEYGEWDSTNDPQNPLNAPVDEQWTFAKFERPVERDVNGDLIANKAGDPIPGVTRDDSRPILTITKNEASFSPTLAWTYRDTVNNATFRGAPAGTCKVSNIQGTKQYDSSIGSFWQVQYQFEFRGEGWNEVLVNQGFRELDGTNLKPITDQGARVTEPQLLDNNGARLAVGASPIPLSFQIYNTANFSVFNL